MSRRNLIIIAGILILIFVSPQEVKSAGTGTISITVTIAEVGIIQATVEFRPEIIRQGNRYIRCYIELPLDYKVEDIDVNTVALTEVNGSPIEPLKTIGRPKIGDFDRDGISDLEVRFDIRTLSPIFLAGDNSLTVTGNLIDGKTFEGTGIIRFIKRR